MKSSNPSQMKRRNSTITSKYPSPPFPRDTYGVPASAAGRSESQANQEDDSSVLPRRRGAQSHNSNGAKTSEYAFFKKLKTDSGQKLHHRLVQENEYRPKRSTPKDCRRVHFEDEIGIARKMSTVGEGDNAVKSSSGDFGCSFPVKSFTRMDRDSCSPPIDDRTTKNSDLCLKKSNADSGQKFHRQSVHEKDYRPKASASKECWREETDIARNTSTIGEGDIAVKNSLGDFRSRFPVENSTHMDFDSFSSPIDYKTAKSSKTTMKKAFSTSEDICSVEEWIGKDRDDMRSGGCHSGKVDIFTRKRRNLHQFVRDCSVPDIDDLCAKGNDVASVLLSRLFLSSNEKSRCEFPQSLSDINTKPKFLSPPKLDGHFKKHDQFRKENFRGVEFMSSLEDVPASLWSDVLSEDMLSSSDSPISYADNTFRQNNLRVSSHHLGGMDTISCVEIKSPFALPLEEYGSPPLLGLPLKELDDFNDVNRSLFEKEEPALLLEWNFKSMTDENNLAITCQNTDLMRNFPVLNLGDDLKHLNKDFESFGACGLSASSVLADFPQTSYPSLSYHSASYQQYDLEEDYSLEEKEDNPIDFNHLPLTLSHTATARYPYLTEDCDDSTVFGDNYGFLSSERHRWSMSKFSYEGHGCPGKEASISHGLGFGVKFLSLGGSKRDHCPSPCHALEFPPKEISSSDLFTEYQDWKSLDDSSYIRNPNHFDKDMTDIHVRPSLYFQLSLNKVTACPLLLDNTNWEESGKGVHYDDNEIIFH